MALLWADGFDHYGTTAIMQTSGLYVAATGIGIRPEADARTGTGALKVSTDGNGGINVRRLINPVGMTIGIGFALKVTGSTGNTSNASTTQYRIVNGSGTSLFSFFLTAAFGLRFTRGTYSSSVIAETEPGIFTLNAYNHMELRVFLDDTNGSIEVRMNGRTPPVLLVTGVDTLGATGTPAEFLIFKDNGASGGQSPQYLDDLTIWDTSTAFTNDFIGDNRCRTRLTASDGPVQNWPVTGAASPYLALDNVPPLPATEYVTADAAGDTSNFGLTQLPTNTAYCAGINMVTMLAKSDAGLCEVVPEIVSGAFTATGAPIVPGTGAAMYNQIFQTDPATGSLFLLPSLQALLGQIRRTL